MPLDVADQSRTEGNGQGSSETEKLLPSDEDRQELHRLLCLALPVQLMMLGQLMITAEAVAFCGRMPADVLAGCVMANLFISLFGTVTGQGIVTACDTLFSRAIGSLERRKLTIYFHQAMQILTFAAVLAWAVIILLDRILLVAGLQPAVLVVAGEYLIFYSPAILFEYYFILQSRYLQCQDYVLIPALSAVGGNLIHILLQLTLSRIFGLNHRLVAVAQALSILTMLIIETVYVQVKGLLCATIDDVSNAFASNWWPFLKLAIPGFLVIVLEILCFRIASLITAYNGVDVMDAQAVVSQVETLVYTIPVSFGIAVSIRVALSLGAGNHSLAKRSYQLSVLVGIGFALLIILVLGIFGRLVPKIFTSNQNVIEIAIEGIYLLLPLQLVEATWAVLCGVLRGCGRHTVAAGLIFVAFYVVALPSGVALDFAAGLQMKGLWIGMILGALFLSCAYFALIHRTNWEEQARIAVEAECEEMQLQTRSGVTYDQAAGIFASPAAADFSHPDARRRIRIKLAVAAALLSVLAAAVTVRSLTYVPTAPAGRGKMGPPQLPGNGTLVVANGTTGRAAKPGE